jgi:hypothetical protein
MHENAATGTKKAREETTVLDYRLIIKRTCWSGLKDSSMSPMSPVPNFR